MSNSCSNATQIGNTFSECNAVCSEGLNSEKCKNCICGMCNNLENLGQTVTDDAKNCCSSINCFNINESPGCFDKCTGGVDTSSYSSDIYRNCCGSPEHQACCQKTCHLGGGAYVPATLQQKLKFKSVKGGRVSMEEDPIDAFCKDKIGFRSRPGAVTYDSTKPYCQQASIIGGTGLDGKSVDPLVSCTCGQDGICNDATDWEACVLLNADKVMNCLKSIGGNALTQGTNEMDGLFCQQQNMSFNCRSCLICNYGNLNEDIKRRFQPTGAPTSSPSPSPSTLNMFSTLNNDSNTKKMLEYSIYGVAGVILLIILILVVSHFMKKKVKVMA